MYIKLETLIQQQICLLVRQQEISEGFDPILDLNLPLSKYYIPREFKLQDCLQNYFKEEEINNAWKYDKCQFIKKSVLRKIQITQTPKYLILHLKRFAQFPKSQKITDEVTYPEILDIKGFCAENVEYTKYALKGVISHMGQLNGGYYVAYAQRQNIWYFDDNIVTKDKIGQHLQDKSAYIIFYEQLWKDVNFTFPLQNLYLEQQLKQILYQKFINFIKKIQFYQILCCS
ncbi:unnamed protein product [Paramecium sonneborni]|uniref:USP domain-containing protein n=1 Tax=Paramecium sonneborni TaxID=65129 RepID=A0A8S1RSE0_9CILI|nr:unnamed protein product [Paramecium sonneborni]